jgi:anti-sigma factor RsiW
MRSCESIDPLVTPYIDRELPDQDRQAVDQHLRACPPCYSRVVAEQAVRDLLHARQPELNKKDAPPSLHARCAALTIGLTAARDHDDNVVKPAVRGQVVPLPLPAKASPPPGGGRLWGRPAWTARLAPFALAASLVSVVGGAFLYQATKMSTRIMAAELAADHVKCFAMNAALGTRQAPSAVESTMLSSFDWRMHLPADPSRAGLELVGARPCLYGEGKIAHIMYRHQGRPVSLFMLPDTERAEGLVKVLGHEAAIWCVNDRTFVLVSREPKQDVERLAAFVRNSLH